MGDYAYKSFFLSRYCFAICFVCLVTELVLPNVLLLFMGLWSSFFTMVAIGMVIVFYMSFSFQEKFFKKYFPYNEFLLCHKQKKGGFFISLNLFGFIKHRKGGTETIRLFRRSLFDLINQFDLKRVSDDEIFSFRTWLLTKRDIRFLTSLGFTVERTSNYCFLSVFIVKVVYFLCNRKLPGRWQWYLVRFDKGIVRKIQEYSSFIELDRVRIIGQSL